MDDNELILDAADRYGFNMEFQVKKKILENMHRNNEKFDVLLNQLIPNKDDFVEVDVMTLKRPLGDFVIECKGSSSSSRLILIQEDNAANPKEYNTTRHQINGSHYHRIAQFKPDKNQYFFTFTGDFFNKQGNQLNKISKNDAENNFFKAQIQILSAIKEISLKEVEKTDGDEDIIFIVPIIITNAQIYIIDYNQKNTQVKNFKWVLHKAPIKNTLSIDSKKDEDVGSISILVLNINYFDDFLKEYKFNRDGEIPIGNGEL